jgi:hypothetical protein
MQRIRNSWELGKISWSVLKSDRTLAWFPVLSAVASLVVVGIFAGLIAATGVDSDKSHEGLKAIGYVFVFAMYVGLAFVTTYFLGALVHAANERLNGHDARFGDSIGAANSRLHRILPWALVQATVSIILRSIEERAGWLGQIVVGLLGAAWSVLTFLTVPIIMLEDVGPVNALKRSGELVKQTWGENLVAQAGFGIIGMLAMLPGIAVLALGIATGSVVVAVAFGILAAVWLAIVLVVVSAMSGIYRVALYRFAVDHKAPPAFADAQLGEAFGPRRQRGTWLG